MAPDSGTITRKEAGRQLDELVGPSWQPPLSRTFAPLCRAYGVPLLPGRKVQADAPQVIYDAFAAEVEAHERRALRRPQASA